MAVVRRSPLACGLGPRIVEIVEIADFLPIAFMPVRPGFSTCSEKRCVTHGASCPLAAVQAKIPCRGLADAWHISIRRQAASRYRASAPLREHLVRYASIGLHPERCPRNCQQPAFLRSHPRKTHAWSPFHNRLPGSVPGRRPDNAHIPAEVRSKPKQVLQGTTRSFSWLCSRAPGDDCDGVFRAVDEGGQNVCIGHYSRSRHVRAPNSNEIPMASGRRCTNAE